MLHTKVTVESLEATWLSRLALRNLTIDDLNGKPLMQVSNLTVGFKLLPAFKGKVELTTVRMFGFTLRINRPTPSEETNMQFIIKALSGGEAESDLSVKAKSLILSRGTVSYDVENKAVTSGVFNTSHLNFSEISGKLALHHYSADSLFAEVKALSFVEASGLKVKKLSAALSGHPDTLDVNDLVIKFPASEIAFPSAVISNSSGKVHLQTGIASVREARITPADFAAFLPALKHFSEKATLSFTLDGSVDSLSVENMSLVYNGGLLALRGNALVEGLAAKGRKLYVAGRSIEACITAEGLQQCMAAFNSQPLPETLRQLGNVALKSEVTGYIDALAVSGEATTDLGALRFNLNALNHYNRDTLLLVKGNVVTDGFNLAKLFADGNNFGSLVCDATLNIMRTPTCSFHLATDANISQIGFNGYDYSGVHLTGSMHGGEYEGIAAIDDPNVKLRAKGAYQTGKITLDAKVEALRPDKLHFTDRYENPTLAFDAGIDIAGNTLDDFIGNIDVNNLTFSTQNDSFAVNNISISSVQDEEAQKTISIESEVADAVIKGQLSLSTLMPELFDVLDDYLPALVSTLKINAVKQSTNYNDFRCMATIVSVNDITRTLKLPFTVDNQAEIKGGFNSRERKVSLEASLPAFAFQGNRFENSLIVIENNNDVATLLVDMTHLNKNALRNKLNIKAVAVNDRIDTRLRWSNDKEERYETTLNTSTVFAAEQSEQSRPALRTEITIPETKVTLKDSVWTVQPSSLTIANGALHIDNFNFTRGERLLRLDGVISDNPRDMLTLEMKDIETAYIFEVVNIPALRFGGAATGTVTGRDLKGSMMLDGKMEVRDFAFNNAPQGLLRMTCEWDNDRQGILMLGTIYKNDSVFTDVNGYIFPVGDNQGLSLWFDANEINIAFLQRYMQAFATNVGGEGFGSVHLFGSFSDIFVEGKPYVKNAKMKINVLNTDYTFSDTVFLERYNITARNTRFYDRDGNEGYINFLLNHHNFRDLRYSLDVNTGKSLVYDIPESVNPKMYGKVYAGGTATVSGDENEITVEGNVSSKAGTSMGFNFVGQTIAADYDFISFTKPLSDTLSVRTAQSANSAAAVAAAARTTPDGMDYRLNFSVEVTPEAQLELVMDPTENDRIKGNGSGSVQIMYGNRTDPRMFGTYHIADGIYNFSLQQMLRKRFIIRDGSSVTFTGDPMNATLNMSAVYNLAANIQDLDESLILETANPSVPVNCVMQLNGRLQNPNIKFDLELPNSNSELQRQVKSYIDTEDMMTRQIIYLLVLSKFYTPDYSRNIYTGDEFSAMASSALSAQLSNILSSLTDKVQIGTNIRSRQDGIKDTEVEMLLSSRLLNNRLLFNGNFGYKDNFIQSNAFVGEFDLEYKLTRTGEISLKAYNHANDLYRYNTKSLTRQGVGLMFRKDFSSLSDIFRRRTADKN